MSHLKKYTIDKNLTFIRVIDKWPREQKIMGKSKVGGHILRTFDMFENLEGD